MSQLKETGAVSAKSRTERLAQAKVVGAYIDTLRQLGGYPYQQQDTTKLTEEIEKISAEIEASGGVHYLHLVEKRRALQFALASFDKAAFSELEGQFVKVAKDYGAHCNITVETWREVSVPMEVLHAAGIVSSPKARRKRTATIKS